MFTFATTSKVPKQLKKIDQPTVIHSTSNPVHTLSLLSPVQRKTYGPVSKSGEKKLLLGTTHGHTGSDLTGEIPQNMRSNSTYIVEYPSLRGTERDNFSDEDISKVQDKTQASLAKDARNNGRTNNIKIIGADGRKAYKGSELHSISLRHKLEGRDYEHNKTAHIIPKNQLLSIGTTYIDKCLGFKGGDVSSLARRTNSLVTYKDGTDLAHVFMTTHRNVQAAATNLPKDRRQSIKRKVLSRFKNKLNTVNQDYRKQKASYKQHNYLSALIEETNNEYMSGLHDILADISLYTETLATGSKNVVVAYGGEHLKELNQLVRETPAKSKKKTRGKFKR